MSHGVGVSHAARPVPAGAGGRHLAMGRPPPLPLPLVVAVAGAALLACAACARPSPPPPLDRDRLLTLQRYVLDGLGLSRLPDVANMNISEAEFAAKHQVYLRAVRENRHLRTQRDTQLTAQKFYSFSHFGGAPFAQSYNGSGDLLYFPVGVKNATVNQATLRVFAVGPPPAEVTLAVYRRRPHGEPGQRVPLDTRPLRLVERSRWAELDVAPAVAAWVSGAARNAGLELECAECGSRGVRLLIDAVTDATAFHPTLDVLMTEREPTPRSPRAMDAVGGAGDPPRYDEALDTDCRKGPNHGRCCRHPMEVVFKDVPGFEFILQPYKFNAGFCRGRCPARYHPASQHALLQGLVWRAYRAPRPCCAPLALADIQVLHLDEADPSALKVSTWRGMQVQRCACS